MRALIVGAGPAGAVSALALRQAGIGAVVLERQTQLHPEAGSWFTVSANGLDALAAVGCLPLAHEIGFGTRATLLLGRGRRPLGRSPLGCALADGTVALTMKRSRLASALVQQCVRRGVDVRFSAEVTAVASTTDGVEVRCADGSRHTGDVMIGADGVHSRVRRWLDPGAPEPRYVGLTNFGGITTGAAATLSHGDREPGLWHLHFGGRAFFGHHVTPTGDVVWFVNVPRPAISAAERMATSAEQWRSTLVDLVAVDPGPAAALIAAGELELVADNTHDLRHVPVWHRDRTVLVGDAAHAPAPSSGQGASLAMEDAVVLVHELGQHDSVGDACAAYERIRRPRVERVVAAGARSSSAKIPGPAGSVLRDVSLRAVTRFALTDARTAWLYGHRVSHLLPESPAPLRGVRDLSGGARPE